MTMGSPDIGGSGDSEYVADSNEALHIKLVRHAAELDSEAGTFHPEMTHQVYGDSESVYGYSGLQIQLFYSAGRLTTYAGFTCKAQVEGGDGATPGADPVLPPLAERLQRPFCTTLAEFRQRLADEEDQFRPPGRQLLEFSGRQKSGETTAPTFCVYTGDVHTPALLDFHERLQTFLLWFIDAANFIDTDDERWRFFFCFERYRSADGGGERVAVAGYATVYEYYAYPSHVRPRLSQLLVLPPFRGRGVASRLLQSIYDNYRGRDDVLDITVEDPSEEFGRVRDLVDCVNCRRLEQFAPEQLAAGFSDEMTTAARRQLKLCPAQTRRVYEILRLGATDTARAADYSAYRLDVKRRLYQPFHREDDQLKKLRRVLEPGELALSVTSREQRLQQLHHSYQQLEQAYLHTLKNLALVD